MDPIIGEIRIFATGKAPPEWMLCNGQLLSIHRYETLFEVIGTTYGGDGIHDFALPNLRGRTPIHAGRGRGLSNRPLGQKGGSEQTTRHITTVTHVQQHDQAVLSGEPDSANNMQPYLAVDYMIAVHGPYVTTT